MAFSEALRAYHGTGFTDLLIQDVQDMVNLLVYYPQLELTTV